MTQRPAAQRPPPGRVFINQVADQRAQRAEVLQDDDSAQIVHIVYTENAMSVNFFDHVKRGKLVPVYLRSNGDKSTDLSRAREISEVLGFGMNKLFWDQIIRKLSDLKSEFKI